MWRCTKFAEDRRGLLIFSMGPSTPTRSKGSTASLARSMATLGLESPLTDVSTNVRARPGASPIRAKATQKPAPAPKLRKDKEDAVPTGIDDGVRGVLSKDWDGPDVPMVRRRSSAMVSVSYF